MSDDDSIKPDSKNELAPAKYVPLGNATPYIYTSRSSDFSLAGNFASYASARTPIELTIGTNAGVIVETHTERTIEKIFYPGSTTIKLETLVVPQPEAYELDIHQTLGADTSESQRHLVVQRCAAGVFIFAIFLVIGNQISEGQFAHPLLVAILVVSSVGFFLMGVAGRPSQGE